MAADPRDTDPVDRDPRESEMGRRSDGASTSLWLVIGGIVLLGLAVYVISAVFV
ncbi:MULTISPECIES: hypothetical protein [unclassified Brevundimonas]|uniref:hypothetical protein n=1 Tax=unclassified Brevundimonas TaxID=2622653 RepID=UPI000AD05687|nr:MULTISPECIES: hypothetical protein [unclassified Brevundimonas]